MLTRREREKVEYMAIITVVCVTIASITITVGPHPERVWLSLLLVPAIALGTTIGLWINRRFP